MGMIARLLIVVVAGLISSWALWRWSYLPVRCNAAVTELQAQTMAAERARGGYDRLVRARANRDRLAGLRDQCRTDVRVFMLAGANDEILGRPEDAERAYGQALTVDHRPEIYANLARVQLELGKVDQAVANYVTAARIHPLVLDQVASEEIMRRVREQLDAGR